MASLFVLLPAHAADTPLFGWREAGAWRFGDTMPVDRAGDTAVALVPGTAVTRHQVQFTAKKPSEARQAALFAVEDDVAEPVDQLHIALGRPDEEGTRDVLVVAAVDMAEWMAWLAANGLAAADLVATHSLMPDGVSAYQAPGEILLRKNGLAFALDDETPDDVLRLIAADPVGPVHGAALARRLRTTLTGEGALNPEAYIEMLANEYEQAEQGSVISLRQGIYTRRRQMGFDGARRWRFVAALAAGLVLLWLASVGLETSAYRNQADALRTETTALINATVPTANGDVDTAIASLRELQRVGASSVRPTIASAALYEALEEASNAEIRSLRYDAAGGQLTALVLIDDYAEADAIAGRLEINGFGVSLGQARQTGAQVLAEFVIEGAAS
ncbi:type II secretion system protein GspL [Henriciella marina]|uniref:type II secretion system protein GspL n=1 Tax=Henriciella marina TaxID=453851 RepID=UPI000366E4D2|nr:type II secretion system protein GspL [Henriciella marina]